ncbi:hypothetical protein CVT25_013730 [Psilocybe cyanescens]|uniref:2Fe-2S ferredoxin-type domain-containing protein n=1 Tax=Psilocybe cyanescens TaxID=93625 RepID=A0A409XL21_PSICY|nr:hypothetical protein CVT25_013730 [Psilocybe cyanescens]
MLGSSYINGIVRPVTRCSVQRTSSCLRQQHSASAARNYHSVQLQCTHSSVGRQTTWTHRSSTFSSVTSTVLGTRMRDMHSSAGRLHSIQSQIPGADQTMCIFIHHSVLLHMGIDRPISGTGLKVHFKDSNGNLIKTVEANEGDDILAIAHEYDIDLEGACEGSVACSTCHVILPEKFYDLLPEPEDDENDMLDMAFGLTDTSRLGCQVKLTKELDGITCTLPSATRNMFVDG